MFTRNRSVLFLGTGIFHLAHGMCNGLHSSYVIARTPESQHKACEDALLAFFKYTAEAMASLLTVPRICDAAAHRRLTATRLWIKPARLRDRRCASRGEASPVLAVARTGLSDGGASSHLIVSSSRDLGHKHLKLYVLSCLDMTLSSALIYQH